MFVCYFQLKDCLPHLLRYLENRYTSIRHMAARCIGMLSQEARTDVMLFVIEKILPLFEATDNETCRQGSSEAISSILVFAYFCNM